MANLMRPAQAKKDEDVMYEVENGWMRSDRINAQMAIVVAKMKQY